MGVVRYLNERWAGRCKSGVYTHITFSVSFKSKTKRQHQLMTIALYWLKMVHENEYGVFIATHSTNLHCSSQPCHHKSHCKTHKPRYLKNKSQKKNKEKKRKKIQKKHCCTSMKHVSIKMGLLLSTGLYQMYIFNLNILYCKWNVQQNFLLC